jgi:TRAP-type C4-dicarboxylate transport system permease small subunit
MGLLDGILAGVLGVAFAGLSVVVFWQGIVRRSLPMRDGRTAHGTEAVGIGLLGAVAYGGASAFACWAFWETLKR